VELTSFERHARVLSCKYKLYGRAAGDEQDVFQEAMIAAWVALRKWTPDHGCSRRTYVKRQMEYRVLDYVRVRANGWTDRDTLPMPEDRAGTDLTIEAVLEREHLEAVVGAFDALPALQRSRLVRSTQGFTPPETAANEGLTVAAVNVALWKGRKALRLALAA
jgi:RNA polymerase sigma factor (sigma-70 family)